MRPTAEEPMATAALLVGEEDAPEPEAVPEGFEPAPVPVGLPLAPVPVGFAPLPLPEPEPEPPVWAGVPLPVV